MPTDQITTPSTTAASVTLDFTASRRALREVLLAQIAQQCTRRAEKNRAKKEARAAFLRGDLVAQGQLVVEEVSHQAQRVAARPSLRHLNLAYAFLLGRLYDALEPTSAAPPLPGLVFDHVADHAVLLDGTWDAARMLSLRKSVEAWLQPKEAPRAA